MSGIPSVLYDAKSKLAETWRNCTADDNTQSLSRAWGCVFPNDSALRQPVEILWIRLAGSKSWAKKFYPPLQWRMWLTCSIMALGYWWCAWVWLFCLMDCCQVLAFLDFFIGNRNIQWLLRCIWAQMNYCSGPLSVIQDVWGCCVFFSPGLCSWLTTIDLFQLLCYKIFNKENKLLFFFKHVCVCKCVYVFMQAAKRKNRMVHISCQR